MQKTKLGISTGFMGAIIYLTALLGGYFPLLLLIGYVLLKEEDEWLKKTSIRAFAILLFFSVLNCVIGLIPDTLNWVLSCVGLFNISISASVITRIFNVLLGAISILKDLFFLLSGLSALKGKEIKINMIDDMIAKQSKQDVE